MNLICQFKPQETSVSFNNKLHLLEDGGDNENNDSLITKSLALKFKNKFKVGCKTIHGLRQKVEQRQQQKMFIM